MRHRQVLHHHHHHHRLHAEQGGGGVQTEDQLCLVMDFVHGGELYTHISTHGRFAEPRARFYAAEVKGEGRGGGVLASDASTGLPGR